MAELKICGNNEGPVNAGEERLLKFLEVNLPDDYYILPNIEIPHLNPRNKQVQYLEYDCIVVTPHALYNIENKDFRGRLEGDDDYWYLNDSQKRNPHKSLRFKTSVLASKLKEKNSVWGRAWVKSIVTLSHPRQTRQGLWGDHLHATFLLDGALIKHLTDPQQVSKQANAIGDIHKAITEEICGTARVRQPHQRKEMYDYEVLEVLNQDNNCVEYLGKPKTGSSGIHKRILEYQLDVPSLPPIQREKRENQITNQYNALKRIRTNPFILNVEFHRDEENHRFYEITDYLDESSLRYEMSRKTFTLEEKTGFVFNLIEALKAAHEFHIYHRDINPENVFLTGGYACLANFGKSYFHDHYQEGYTVMATITEANATAYHPLELLAGDASRNSDIYSLGVLVYELFTGQLPFNNPFELNRMGGKLTEDRWPTAINASLPEWLDVFCKHTLRIPPEDRWDNLTEMKEFLEVATKKNETSNALHQVADTSIPINFEIGSRVGDYTLYEPLGEGGYSQVFLAMHNMQSQTQFALKIYHASVSAKTVQEEYTALFQLEHRNIVKFIWNGILNNGQFYTVMEYLKGENLKKYAKGDARLPAHRVYQVAEHLLKALVMMQGLEKPLFHRDIKPQNVVWEKEGDRFVLIDFNVASETQGNSDHVGTYPYLAPDLILDGTRVNWNTSADTFALGITLYELACKKYPWGGKMPEQHTGPTDPQSHQPQLATAWAAFLRKAVQPEQTKRFSTAQEMLDALLAIDPQQLLQPIVPPEAEVLVVNAEGAQDDYVRYLNTLYSQSRHGNAGTRASSEFSTFDKLTYSPTKLDHILIPDVLDGRYRLVIITGNAGDGKTAFIRKIEEQAQNREGLAHGNGAKFTIQSTPFQSNYDGSQDEVDQVNDTVLEQFFQPFAGQTTYHNSTEGRLIAINEGRLVEFLRSAGEFDHLADTIENYFYQEGQTELPEGLLIINLNLRSMVAAGKEEEESLFRQQVKKLTAKPLWKKCETCAVAETCFIRHNAATLNDTAASDEVISRLEWLVRTVSLKRELHITMRDLRSFISFLITRDYHCDDIPGLSEQLKGHMDEWWQLFYFNLSDPALNDSGWQDRLIRLIRETDVAERPQPALDRDLFYGLHQSYNYLEFSERQEQLLDHFNQLKATEPAYEQDADRQQQIKRIHKLWVRHQYFEGNINFRYRLPYHAVSKFHRILSGSNPEEQQKDLLATRKSIAKAIALNEGCTNPAIYAKNLVLSSAHTDDPFSQSFRLFDLTDFELVVEQSSHLVNYLEYEPDHLIFRKKSEPKVALTLSLDLFEMLDFISQGYSPSLNDIRGRFIELQIFKNMLENEVYRKVVVTKNRQQFYQIELNAEQALELTPLILAE
jgi:serine/threonine protein kinase